MLFGEYPNLKDFHLQASSQPPHLISFDPLTPAFWGHLFRPTVSGLVLFPTYAFTSLGEFFLNTNPSPQPQRCFFSWCGMVSGYQDLWCFPKWFNDTVTFENPRFGTGVGQYDPWAKSSTGKSCVTGSQSRSFAACSCCYFLITAAKLGGCDRDLTACKV